MSARKTIMLTVTEKCNLNCTYCYEKNKTLKTMNYETAIKIIDEELTVNDGYEECEIQFFGGEPFFEFELIKSVCEYIWSKQYPKKYQCFATTNGTLVHGEIKKWLFNNKDNFICGLSLDGNKKAHDINRCQSFDLIDIDFFKKTWPEQTAKMTISPESLPYLADSVIFLHEQGIPFSNNLAYGVDWSDDNLIETMQLQLKKLADYYIDNPNVTPCKMLNMRIEDLNYPQKIKRWCGAGIGLKAYDTFGNAYPCHLFQPMSYDADRSIASIEKCFIEQNTMDPRCDKCSIYNVCPTCYGHNYASTGDIAKRDESLCRFTKLNTLVISYIWLKKFERYSREELRLSKQRYRALFDASKKIQEELPKTM